MSSLTLVRWNSFQIRAHWSVVPALLILWFVLAWLGRAWFSFTLPQALWGGLLAALLHYDVSLAHHLGHAWAAHQTGYPMAGIRLWTLLGMSVYPKNEPELPAATHRRRAWGGPVASLLVALLFALLTWLLRPVDGIWWFITAFAAVDSFIVFTVGALLPLGFTDGSTLLHYRG